MERSPSGVLQRTTTVNRRRGVNRRHSGRTCPIFQRSRAARTITRTLPGGPVRSLHHRFLLCDLTGRLIGVPLRGSPELPV